MYHERYTSLRRKALDLEIAAPQPGPQVHILEDAVPATKPSRPKLDVSWLLTPAVVAALLAMAFLAAMAPPTTPGQNDGAM